MTGNKVGAAGQRPNKIILGRTLILMAVCGVVAFAALALQLYKVMIRDHEYYEQLAVENQTRETVVTALRGDIRDRNGNVLAMSATAYTVYISPYEMEKYGENASEIAGGLSEILGVDYDAIMAKWEDTASWYKTVATKIESELADEVRAFKSEGTYKSIHIEADSKRYYPYSTLASHVIGFVGSDGYGLEGVEVMMDDYLEGTNGSVVRLTTAEGADMLLTDYEYYMDAVDGSNVNLTLDVTIQSIVEKYLDQAVADYDAKKGGYAVVMDVTTGEILALAVSDSYDLNNYLAVSDKVQEELSQISDQAEYKEELGKALNRQWRNPVVADTYEPGSVFKSITMAIALEEGAADTESTYYCGGSMSVLGRTGPLHCWKTPGHGSQTLTEAAQHSCNVAFATIGLSVGAKPFYKYIDAFGLFDKTGIDLTGEAGSQWWPENVFYNPENLSQLASASFGQTFNVTPIQMITAFSAAVNGGNLMKPYVVSSVTDEYGKVIHETTPTVIRRAISEKTSSEVCSILEQVVGGKEGTGKNAAVPGYRIGGKTGTSTDTTKQVATGEKEYKVSFCGFAPANDPKLAILLILDSPSEETKIYISGGVMAAPVVGKILSEVLPYIGIAPDYSEEETAKLDVTVPTLSLRTVEEAKSLLTEKGLGARVVGEGDTVTDQLPHPGAEVAAGTQIVLYAGEKKPENVVTVPNLKGMTVSQAKTALQNIGLYLDTSGASPASSTVIVSTQSAEAGSEVLYGSVVEIVLVDTSNLGRY